MDLTSLSQEQLRALKAQLDGITDTSGRSPFRPRQLHDLNRKPAADDPRPLFVWSAEQPIDYQPGPPKYFPRLLWHVDTGQEITARDEQHCRELEAQGYSKALPASFAVADPVAEIQALFDRLSPEDQALLLEEQQKDKRARMTAKLATLTDGQLEALVSRSETKRKPGRPRKDAVA